VEEVTKTINVPTYRLLILGGLEKVEEEGGLLGRRVQRGTRSREGRCTGEEGSGSSDKRLQLS